MRTLLLLGMLLLPSLLPAQRLLIANQVDHTLVIVDAATGKTLATVGVDINGHEVAASPDGRLAYVPIYGNSGVGRPGTDGSTVQVIDIVSGRAIHIIDLGKPVRPHCAKFAPDGLLYVSAELASAVDVIDPKAGRVVAEIPTGAKDSHMLAISPDGSRAYTSNVYAGSVSVLDLRRRTLVAMIPVAKHLQRISISPDGSKVYTHDQEKPRIAVIDAATNSVGQWWELPAVVYSSAPTADGRWLIANALSGKLFVIDAASGRVEHSFALPPSTGAVVISPDGLRAYVSCPQSGTVQVLNLKEWKLETPMEFTRGADGMAFAPIALAVTSGSR